MPFNRSRSVSTSRPGKRSRRFRLESLEERRLLAQVLNTFVYNEITTLPASLNHNTLPKISADGQHAVFGRSIANQTHIFTINTDGSGLKEVDVNVETGTANLSISADGKVVLDPARRHLSVNGQEILHLDDPDILDAQLSADGAHIVFVNYGDTFISSPHTFLERGLYVINPDGTGLRELAGPHVAFPQAGRSIDAGGFSTGYQYQVSISNDGSHIIFDVITHEGGPELYGINLDGSGLHRLAFPSVPDSVMNLAISGDGATVVYLAQFDPTHATQPELGLFKFDGTNRRVLSPGNLGGLGNGETLQLSSNGSKLLYENGDSGIAELFDTDGSGKVVSLGFTSPTAVANPMVYNGLFRASMDATARRFVYINPDINNIEQLATLDLNPATTGKAPVITNPTLDPDFLVVNEGSSATVTAHVSVTGTLRGGPGEALLIGPLHDLDANDRTLFDDGTHGDAVAGDGVYSNSVVSTRSNTTGQRTVRVTAESMGTDGHRHATAVEFAGPAVVILPGTPGVPTLTTQSDTGISHNDGITRNNGAAAAPLVFNVSETPEQNDFYRLFDVTNPNQPVLIAGPLQAINGTVTVAAHVLGDGVHKIAATTANAPIGAQSALSGSVQIVVDTTAPTSAVNALAATSYVTSFLVGWSGTDGAGSGIASYTVLVSDNGGTFNPFKTNTTATSATFSGQAGHTYGFSSVATDIAGNAQPTVGTPQRTTFVFALGVPNAPVLSAGSDTGVSNSDGVTQYNGSIAAPLTFNVSETPAQNDEFCLFEVSNPSKPLLLTGPVRAINGTLTVQGLGLGSGVHKIAATTVSLIAGMQSSLSPTTTITIQPNLQVVSVTPGLGTSSALPGGKVVVTFSHPLAGLTADDATGRGFTNFPFAVYLAPRGPSGVFSAPSGLDGGSVPLHATLVYHVNAVGTSTITLTPTEPLGTDIYVIAIGGNLTDLAGNKLTDAKGVPGTEFRTFEILTTARNTTPLKVTAVTTQHATVKIPNNATIAQPDTIAIAFNKPVNYLTINSTSVQLLAGPTNRVVASRATYSPTNKTVYLTPQAVLAPGTVYTIRVAGSVTDDQSFPTPNKGFSLGKDFKTSFKVKSAGVGPGQGPLVVLSSNGHPLFSPGFGPARTSFFGYASIPFSERLDMTAMGRFAVKLIAQSGGLSNTEFDSADEPLNAKLAFNPNTNTLILVPTVLTGDDTYLYALGALKATNGDILSNPGVGLPLFDTFTVSTGRSPQVVRASVQAAETSVANTAHASQPRSSVSSMHSPASSAPASRARPAHSPFGMIRNGVPRVSFARIRPTK